MSWRMAKSLEILLAQVNALAPGRDKSSDGGIGNAEHSARESDHNPNEQGVVCARDFTNDPAHMVSEQLAEALRASRDPRIKYIISNRKIAASYATGGQPPWAWRPYNGANPHNHHCHVSVLGDAVHYDDTRPWQFTMGAVAAPTVQADPVKPNDPVLRKGDKGPDVVRLQVLLNSHGAILKEDGDFGNGTKAAVEIVQTKLGIVADGVVGKYTWEALKGKPQ